MSEKVVDMKDAKKKDVVTLEGSVIIEYFFNPDSILFKTLSKAGKSFKHKASFDLSVFLRTIRTLPVIEEIVEKRSTLIKEIFTKKQEEAKNKYIEEGKSEEEAQKLAEADTRSMSILYSDHEELSSIMLRTYDLIPKLKVAGTQLREPKIVSNPTDQDIINYNKEILNTDDFTLLYPLIDFVEPWSE